MIHAFWVLWALSFLLVCALLAADLWNTMLDRPDAPTGKPPWLP